MKLPNNYGSVTKLKGNRRRPWVARVSTGTVVNYATHKAYPKQTALGYYETRKEAMQALAEYNANPFNVDQHNMTISELWGQIADTVKCSNERRKVYKRAFHNHIEFSIGSEKILDVKVGKLQNLFDSIEHGYSTKSNVRAVLNQIYLYALQNDIIQQNYMEYVKIGSEETHIERQLYSPEEIANLWANKDAPLYSMTLVLLYEGMRIKELRELPKDNVDLEARTISITEAKNEQSKRVIPIHDAVLPLIEKQMKSPGISLYGFTKTQYAYFTSQIGHKPYDVRHTFASRANALGIPKLTIQRIMGHKPDSVLEQAYIHLTMDELREAINTVCY
ncbi:MAG: site-specific integrase [Lachnospiraceae bacterium]|nr:site-specific integrase [Lachnospiraceae bacterium]